MAEKSIPTPVVIPAKAGIQEGGLECEGMAGFAGCLRPVIVPVYCHSRLSGNGLSKSLDSGLRRYDNGGLPAFGGRLRRAMTGRCRNSASISAPSSRQNIEQCLMQFGCRGRDNAAVGIKAQSVPPPVGNEAARGFDHTGQREIVKGF